MFTIAQPAMTRLGDHPDAAGSRLRWVRQLAQTAGGGRKAYPSC
jgi:hypothetical protein